MRIILAAVLILSLNSHASRSDGKEPGTKTEWQSAEAILRFVYPKQIFDDLNAATARLASEMPERDGRDPNILLLPDIMFRGINGLYPTTFNLDWNFVSLGVPAQEIGKPGFDKKLLEFATQELLHYRHFRDLALRLRNHGVEIKVEAQISLLAPFMELLSYELSRNSLRRNISIVMTEFTGTHQSASLQDGVWTIYAEIDPKNLGEAIHRLDVEFLDAPKDCAYDLRGGPKPSH